MFTSIRARIVALSVAIVVTALMVNAGLNYFVANNYNSDAVSNTLTAVEESHVAGVAEWAAVHGQMIGSLQDAVLQPDSIPALKQVAAAGGFTNVYVGYADKTAKFSDATGIPSDYDPTGRPWYKQAAAAGKDVVTPPYVDVGTGKVVVAFATPVVRDGVVKAVVSGDVAMDSVIANVKAIHPTPGSFGMLVDSSGQIVAHPDAKLTLKPVTDLTPDLTSERLASALNAERPLQADVGGSAKSCARKPCRAPIGVSSSHSTSRMRRQACVRC
jgi:methyl-accepting chemotaxis protein